MVPNEPPESPEINSRAVIWEFCMGAVLITNSPIETLKKPWVRAFPIKPASSAEAMLKVFVRRVLRAVRRVLRRAMDFTINHTHIIRMILIIHGESPERLNYAPFEGLNRLQIFALPTFEQFGPLHP